MAPAGSKKSRKRTRENATTEGMRKRFMGDPDSNMDTSESNDIAVRKDSDGLIGVAHSESRNIAMLDQSLVRVGSTSNHDKSGQMTEALTDFLKTHMPTWPLLENLAEYVYGEDGIGDIDFNSGYPKIQGHQPRYLLHDPEFAAYTTSLYFGGPAVKQEGEYDPNQDPKTVKYSDTANVSYRSTKVDGFTTCGLRKMVNSAWMQLRIIVFILSRGSRGGRAIGSKKASKARRDFCEAISDNVLMSLIKNIKDPKYKSYCTTNMNGISSEMWTTPLLFAFAYDQWKKFGRPSQEGRFFSFGTEDNQKYIGQHALYQCFGSDRNPKSHAWAWANGVVQEDGSIIPNPYYRGNHILDVVLEMCGESVENVKPSATFTAGDAVLGRNAQNVTQGLVWNHRGRFCPFTGFPPKNDRERITIEEVMEAMEEEPRSKKKNRDASESEEEDDNGREDKGDGNDDEKASKKTKLWKIAQRMLRSGTVQMDAYGELSIVKSSKMHRGKLRSIQASWDSVKRPNTVLDLRPFRILQLFPDGTQKPICTADMKDPQSPGTVFTMNEIALYIGEGMLRGSSPGLCGAIFISNQDAEQIYRNWLRSRGGDEEQTSSSSSTPKQIRYMDEEDDIDYDQAFEDADAED